MGAVALGTFAASAQELPAIATGSASATMPAEQRVDSKRKLENGAECRVYTGGIDDYSAYGTRNRVLEKNIQLLDDLLNSTRKGKKSGYDATVNFDGIEIGKGVQWNVVTWKGYLDYSEEQTVTFISKSAGPYVISINGKVWKGYGEMMVNVPLKEGLNEVKIGKVSINPERTRLSLSFRTTEFGQYEPFTPRNLFHEVREEEGGKMRKW